MTATISEGAALAITNLNARIYNTAGLSTLPTLGTVAGEVDSSNSTVGGLTVATIGTTLLNPGTYVLEIRGTASGSSGGTYSGVLNLTTPVPLPAALPLLISALGGLGLIRRKRVAEAPR